jgi:hypothetical protein
VIARFWLAYQKRWRELAAGLLVTGLIGARLPEQQQRVHNEPDVLPYARQFTDNGRISPDWYLNLEAPLAPVVQRAQ